LNASNFSKHIARLTQIYSTALDQCNAEGGGFDAILLHSGSEHHYFADDRGIPFQAFGHFCHWLPVNRPNQFVLFCPGQKSVYFQVVPNDFWYDQSIDMEDWWAEQFNVIRLSSVAELGQHLPGKAIAYLGAQPELAKSLGLELSQINPGRLTAYLDFCRAVKSDYELDQLREANRIALQGHAAARQCFIEGGNEYEIHLAFLRACDILENESPYTNIVALDEKSAILHYQFKRREPAEAAQVLLIDAGCRLHGYGSDITRTHTKDEAHPVFRSLLSSMERLEQDLVTQIKPGMAYQELHDSALDRITSLLIEHDICKGSKDDLQEQQLAQLFMPHGVGHLLGIQVHDVGGHQKDSAGNSSPPSKHSPALRNTRIMEENMVFTVEPGLYFIPLLLEQERNTARGRLINWSLVDELYPCGGIRVEDNVRVRRSAAENLTRQFE